MTLFMSQEKRRSLSTQLFCKCSFCRGQSCFPLNEDTNDVKLCACKTKKLNKVCWNLRKCEECDAASLAASIKFTEQQLLAQGDAKMATTEPIVLSESESDDDSDWDELNDGELSFDSSYYNV